MTTRHLGLMFTRILTLFIIHYIIIIYPVADAGRATASPPFTHPLIIHHLANHPVVISS